MQRRNARPVNQPRAPRNAPYPAGDSGLFLNPYNFVPALEPPRPEVLTSLGDDDPARLLLKCQPPPHDRYLGLSGRITCSLRLDTDLFVADSHAVSEDPAHSGHFRYRFFEYAGQPAIPSTSLRGAVRSLFEAATISCFAVFDDRALSYRLNAREAAGLVPGRVRWDSRGKRWWVQLLTGDTPLRIAGVPDYGAGQAQYAAWVLAYPDTWPSATANGAPRSAYAGRRLLRGIGVHHHGKGYFALLQRVERPHNAAQHTGPWWFWNVRHASRNRAKLERLAQPGEIVVSGYLCITNRNIPRKHDERFFFYLPTPAQPEPATLLLSDAVVTRYEALLADYVERYEQRLARGEGAAGGGGLDASRFLQQRQVELQNGDLVYVRLSGTITEPTVEYLAPVMVPRLLYRSSTGRLLPHNRPCEGGDTVLDLCPACRMFGWVYGAHGPSKPLPAGKPTAYRGRLRFSHARLTEDHGACPTPVTLSILSAPKPTTTRLYVGPAAGPPRAGLDDRQAGYDGPGNRLRGRKFYRFQAAAHPAGQGATAPSNQNRTVANIRLPGNIFTFTIDFTNLAAVELGALLWTLEQPYSAEERGRLRLGMGKPLGLGSATVTVDSLQVFDPVVRCEGGIDGGWRDALPAKDKLVNGFRTALASLYPNQQFERLPNISALRALLARAPILPVHYPRVRLHPHPGENSYDWFRGNGQPARRYPLRTPEEEAKGEGLPFMDKFGNLQ